MTLLFFLAATVVMTGVGWLLLMSPIRKQQYDRVFQGFMFSLAAKATIGIIVFVLALKVMQYPPPVAAIGTVTAYLVALIVTTLAAIRTLKRGSR